MDAFEFLERTEGAMLWHEYQLDEQLNNLAWYTANLMMSSGNMKKGTDALKIKKGLYRSLEDVESEKPTPQKDVSSEKAKLLDAFGLADA